jgi:hypothetical protein
VPGGDKLLETLKTTPTVLIDADCGLGKSTCIRQCLELLHAEYQGTLRVLIVSVRVIHAYDIAAAVKSDTINPVTYLDKHMDGPILFNQACIVVSMEQMYRASDVDKPWDVVILDEIRSGLGKFIFESTLKDMNSVIQFDRVCRECKYLIAADADCRKDGATEVFLKGLHRPYVVWDVPIIRLHRKLSVEFISGSTSQTTIPQIFKNELEALQDGERLGVVCSTATAAKTYAQYCANRGVSHVLYHGSVSASKKRDDFRNPDAAWADKQVVIYNLCVTVGVDPKSTTFKCMFMHTSYGGGDWLAVFQAIKRFNRHRRGEFIIHVVLTCKRPEAEALENYTNALHAADREVSRPTLEKVMAQVKTQQRSFGGTFRHCLDEAGLRDPSMRAPPYFAEVRAHVQLTALKHSNKHTHFAEFMRMAQRSGWPVEYKGDVAAARLRDLIAPRQLSEEESCEIEGTEGLVAKLAEQLQEDEHDAMKCHLLDMFRIHTEELLEKHASQRSVFDTCAVELFFHIYNLRGEDALPLFSDEAVKAYRSLKANFGKITRYVNVVYRSQRDIYLHAALRYQQGHHPHMKCKEINFAHSYDAWTIFTLTMQCRREESEIAVPEDVIDVLNREKRREALLGRDDGVKQQMVHAASLLNVQKTATVWQCMHSICTQFGFKPHVKRCDRTINGSNYRNLFRSIELRRDLPFLENWSLYDSRVLPSRFVKVGDWARHEEELDLQTIEDIYDRDTELLADITQGPQTQLGTYEELVDDCTLRKLYNADEPPFRDDADGRSQRKKWNRDQKRLNAMYHDGVYREDGAMVLRLTCYKKYGVGRRIMEFPSLQACPKIHRGPLANRYCHDLDIENAHYSMMRQIAEAHGAKLACVEHYCNHTQECRQLVQDFYGCTKKAAKQLFLSLLNGGDVPKWMYDFKINRRLQEDLREGRVGHPGIVQQLRTEYATIQRIMFTKYEGQVNLLMDQIKQANPQKPYRFDSSTRRMLPAEDDHQFEMRVRRSAFSTLLQEEEDKALQAIEGKVRELDRVVRCPIFDGCLIERKGEEPLSGDFIRACEGAIHDMTGYNLKLWEKCLICGEKLHECVCAGRESVM